MTCIRLAQFIWKWTEVSEHSRIFFSGHKGQFQYNIPPRLRTWLTCQLQISWTDILNERNDSFFSHVLLYLQIFWVQWCCGNYTNHSENVQFPHIFTILIIDFCNFHNLWTMDFFRKLTNLWQIGSIKNQEPPNRPTNRIVWIHITLRSC